jgi:hypothetical protein
MPAVSPPATASICSKPTSRRMVVSAISMRARRTRGYEISLRQSMYTGLAQPDVKMNGFSALKCTACTSSSIFAVVSEIV